MKRYVYLGVALGLTMVLASAFTSLSACYRVPTPTCGFRCGPSGECPEDYTCSSFEDRCHLNGSDPNIRCDTTDDPPPDSSDGPIIADAPDAPLDGAVDATLDAELDAASDSPTD